MHAKSIAHINLREVRLSSGTGLELFLYQIAQLLAVEEVVDCFVEFFPEGECLAALAAGAQIALVDEAGD